jgi:hypothetical protein
MNSGYSWPLHLRFWPQTTVYGKSLNLELGIATSTDTLGSFIFGNRCQWVCSGTKIMPTAGLIGLTGSIGALRITLPALMN